MRHPGPETRQRRALMKTKPNETRAARRATSTLPADARAGAAPHRRRAMAIILGTRPCYRGVVWPPGSDSRWRPRYRDCAGGNPGGRRRLRCGRHRISRRQGIQADPQGHQRAAGAPPTRRNNAARAAPGATCGGYRCSPGSMERSCIPSVGSATSQRTERSAGERHHDRTRELVAHHELRLNVTRYRLRSRCRSREPTAVRWRLRRVPTRPSARPLRAATPMLTFWERPTRDTAFDCAREPRPPLSGVARSSFRRRRRGLSDDRVHHPGAKTRQAPWRHRDGQIRPDCGGGGSPCWPGAPVGCECFAVTAIAPGPRLCSLHDPGGPRDPQPSNGERLGTRRRSIGYRTHRSPQDAIRCCT